MPANLPVYCPTGTNKYGDVITSRIKIYDQCVTDRSQLGAIKYELTVKDQVGGTGLTFTDTSQSTPINTAESVIAIQKLFAGREMKWTAAVQKGAFSSNLDELVYGTEYTDSADNAGWVEMALADQVGKEMPRYCVIIDYYKGTQLFATDWIPAAEVMLEGGSAMAAGVIYNRNLVMDAQTAPVPGYPDDTRAIRYYDTRVA